MASDDSFQRLKRPYPVDAPRRRYTKRAKPGDDRMESAAMIGALSIAVSAMFIPPSLTLGAHWQLEEEESFALAESLQKALMTLPGSTYADIKKYIERFIPWVALTITTAQIVGKKWEQTQHVRRAAVEEFPASITVENFGPPAPTERQRQEVESPYPTDGPSDTFKPFGGTD